MEYTEDQAINDLYNGGYPFFRTGSREICNPKVMNTDVDFVVLDVKYNGNFEKNGFMKTSSEDSEYDETDFETYRRGEVNLIVLHTKEQFRAWEVATAAAKQMNLIRKIDRIRLFQGVLYGNWQ